MRLWRPLLAVAVLLFICTSLIAGDKKDGEGTSSANFIVLKDENGKPVRNAAVVLHPVGKNEKQKKTGFELKTDADGKTHFDGIPYGLLRVQVIAHGFQTFGEDFQMNQPEQDITIRLKRPQGQYSIYENNDGRANGTATSTGSSNGTTTNGTGTATPPPDK
jgi:Carboxypeptidase regulatory-like domain